jgi:hypothetical protein
MKITDIIVEAKVSVRDQIIAAVKKDGGKVDDYFVRFTDVDQLGYSARQKFGRTVDVDDPSFDPDYIGANKGKPALWFYPLKYYLSQKDSYATDKPYIWVVKLKPDAWLQPANYKTTEKEPAPAGKQRVGFLRKTSVPAAIFFQPGYELVAKIYDYGSQHQRHGQVRGAPKKPGLLSKVLGMFGKGK